MMSATVWAIFNLIWGIINLFSGYRVFRLFLALSGAYLGFQLSQQVFHTTNSATILIIMILAALISSVLALALYSFIFSVLGGIGGLMLALTYLQYYPLQSPLSWLLIGVGIIIGVGLGSVLKKVVVVLVTSAGGASFVVQAITYFLPQFSGHSSLIWIILVIIGILSQMSQHPL